MKFRLCFVVQLALYAALPALGQQNGRFSELKNQGFGLFQRGKYLELAGKMEEIWEQDHSDPKVAEYLAIGYVYGEHNPAKAKPLMEQAIAGGGQATFLVSHSHEHLAALQGDPMNQFCTGRISVSPGKLVFVSDSGEHSVSLTPAELKDFRVGSGAPGRIHIKSGGKSYVFQVKSQTRDEAVLLRRIAEENLKR
ncbi:MAG: hypothetical protein ACJ74Y_04275 [Bryobacteraceae bacterium]